MTVVLRQVKIDAQLDAEDPFARTLAAALRRHLPSGWSLGHAKAAQPLRLIRDNDGGWRLVAGAGEIAIDDLAVGAAAARHLAALGARDLRYAGSPADSLRWRGFAIASGALGLICARLTKPAELSREHVLGVFADGMAAESAALNHLAAAGLSVPRDVLLLGIEDGRLPAPRAPGLSRLRVDPEGLAHAAITLLASGSAERILLPPAGVVTRASSDGGGEYLHLAAAMAHLRANLHRPLDVITLAKAAGLPRRSLERIFRSALGRSPLDEIRRQRIARAQELLAHSDLPLAQVALRSGFSGADRLGVVFLQVAGVTPGSWRSQHRKG